MSTLTADTPVVPHHCAHKLPTSCRLTALPICCACQDLRPHSASYSKYVDGVGFVPWGTRQERYCWPCKGLLVVQGQAILANQLEFWDARIAASGLRPSDTKIPDRPDQQNFLQQWYDWHRGYRVIERDDGTEEHQPIVGENLADVPPGFLPRTLEELGNGTAREAERQDQEISTPVAPSTESELNIYEEDRIFDLPDEPLSTMQTTNELNEGAEPTIMPSTVQEELQRDPGRDFDLERSFEVARDHYRRVAALRRELQRMRIGIERVMSGLQALGEEAPNPQDALQRTAELTSRLQRIEDQPITADTTMPSLRATLQVMRRRLGSGNNLDPEVPQSDGSSSSTANETVRRDNVTANSTTDSGEAPPTLEQLNHRVNGYLQIEGHHEHALRVLQAERNTRQEYLDSTLRDVQRHQFRIHRVREARARVTESMQAIQAASRVARVFGTREEIQQADYVSPIGGMFERAYNRYREHEENRRRAQDLGYEGEVDSPANRSQEAPENVQGLLLETVSHSPRTSDSTFTTIESIPVGGVTTLTRIPFADQVRHGTVRAQQAVLHNIDEVRDQFTMHSRRSHHNVVVVPRQPLPLRQQPQQPDDENTRVPSEDAPCPSSEALVGSPMPITDPAEFFVEMKCEVCYEQLANVVCTPCGHVCLCKWCADEYAPRLKVDATKPMDQNAKCPKCRKRIRNMYTIYGGATKAEMKKAVDTGVQTEET